MKDLNNNSFVRITVHPCNLVIVALNTQQHCDARLKLFDPICVICVTGTNQKGPMEDKYSQ